MCNGKSLKRFYAMHHDSYFFLKYLIVWRMDRRGTKGSSDFFSLGTREAPGVHIAPEIRKEIGDKTACLFSYVHFFQGKDSWLSLIPT